MDFTPRSGILYLDHHEIFQESFCLVLKSHRPHRITISVPHDGISPQGILGDMISVRQNGVMVSDKNVWPIAADITASQFPISQAISAVRGLMPRRFVDYNRSWPEPINYYPETQSEVDTGLDDSRLSPAYFAYHHSISTLISQSVNQFGNENSLLIDLHGFSVQPSYAPHPDGYDLILGTGNRQTIPYGEIDFAMEKFMEKHGYSMFVPEDIAAGGQVEDIYSADFTTRHHSAASNINAIQIEVASKFRDSHQGQNLGKKLSRDVVDFLQYFYGSMSS